MRQQKQQSETSRTSSGCTGRQGHCRRSALLSHPALMPREKDSEKCLCSDKEEEKNVQKNEKPGQIKTDACRGFGTAAGA